MLDVVLLKWSQSLSLCEGAASSVGGAAVIATAGTKVADDDGCVSPVPFI